MGEQEEVGAPTPAPGPTPTPGPAAERKTAGMAIAALVCGIAAFFIPFAGFVLAILGIVLGVRARAQVDASRGQLKGRGMAVTGLVLGIVALGFAFIWLAIFGFIGACRSAIPTTY